MNSITADSIFLSAIEKKTLDEMEAYLAAACGVDAELRQRVDRLIAAHRLAATNFLEQPATGLFDREMPARQMIDLQTEALETGFASTFGKDAAVVVGSAGHSVLKSLEKQIGQAPSVILRDDPRDRTPAVDLQSKQTPSNPSDSRYQLHGEIARGGMGAIIKGRDTDLGRDLAIKVLLDAHKQNPEYIARFVEEAQIGGQLQHPGIVPVYELGQFGDQRPYFTMKLVKGQTLASLLSKRKSPQDDLPKLLGIFEQICQTMAYAHSKGVIHRDLKPANIMVGAFGEVQVMDWGLSKVLRQGGIEDEKKSLEKHRDITVIHTRRSTGSDESFSDVGSNTRHGSIMGTPAYMPPEQALGEVDMLDTRADVFGLGAILAEILTGKPPYVADDATQVFRMASRGKLDTCFGRLDTCEVDSQLIEITKQALAPDVDDRLADADELSQHITAYLEGVQDRLKQAEIDKVEAQARSEEERRRKKLYVAIAGLLLLITCSGVIGSLVVARQQTAIAEKESQIAREQQQLAQSEAKRADDQEKNAREQAELRGTAEREREAADARANELARSNYLIHLANADRAILSKNLALARIELDACPVKQRGWTWTFLDNRIRATVPFTLYGSEKPTFSRDGRRLVSAGFYDYGTLDHNNALVWDLESGNLAATLKNDAEVSEVAVFPDGRYVAGADNDNVFVWNVKTGEKRWSTKLTHGFYDGVAVSPDGKSVGVASWQKMITVLDADSGEVRFTLGPLEGGFRAVSFSADSRWLAVGMDWDRNGPSLIVDAATGKLAARFPGHDSVPTFAPVGHRLASGIDDSITLWNWNGENLTKEASWSTGQSSVYSLDFTADGSRLISGCANGEVSVWDVATGKLQAQFDGGDEVYWLSACPEGNGAAFFTIADGIRLWRFETSNEGPVVSPPREADKGTFVRFSPDGQRTAAGTSRQVRILDAESGNTMSHHTGTYGGGSWSHDGSKLVLNETDSAGASEQLHVQLLDIHTGSIVPFSTGDTSTRFAQTVNSGQTLFTVDSKGIHAWEIASGEEILHIKGGRGQSRISVSPDGSHIAAGSELHTSIRIWNLRARKVTQVLNSPGLWPMAMVFTADSKRLYVGSNGGRLNAFDIESGELAQRYSGHSQLVTSIALSPDEDKLVAADSRGRVIIWDVASAQPLITLLDDDQPIQDVDWSSDGRRVAVCKADGTVQIWDLPIEP